MTIYFNKQFVFFLLILNLLSVSSCKKEVFISQEEFIPGESISEINVANRLSAMGPENGHGSGFRFLFDNQSNLESFNRSFNEDYHVSIQTICDFEGYVQTLVTNYQTTSGNQVDSLPVTYNNNLVEEFSFFNQFGGMENFVFSYDAQDRIIAIDCHSTYSPTTIYHERFEFTFTEDNVTRVDQKIINGGIVTGHWYTIYTYDSSISPYSLMDSKYYPFLCAFNVGYPLSENKPVTETNYSMPNNSIIGITHELIYEYREDNYPERYQSDGWGYYFNYD